MFQEVGVLNARAKLSELLRAVQDAGRCGAITIRGESVAYLVPSETARQQDAKAAIAAMRAFRKVRGVSAQEIDNWIGEGRRYWGKHCAQIKNSS